MRTQPLNSAEKNNTNIIAAGVGGGAAAALVTRYMPLSKAEHDDAFKTVASQIAKHVREAKEEEFKNIVDEIANNKKLDGLSDVFIFNKGSIIDGTQEQLERVASNLDENSKGIFSNLTSRISDKGKAVEKFLNADIIKQAKRQRPIFYFAALAAAASMTLAVLKNVITAKKVQEQTVGISYDKEGMIIDAPDSLSLAIILDEYA